MNIDDVSDYELGALFERHPEAVLLMAEEILMKAARMAGAKGFTAHVQTSDGHSRPPIEAYKLFKRIPEIMRKVATVDTVPAEPLEAERLVLSGMLNRRMIDPVLELVEAGHFSEAHAAIFETLVEAYRRCGFVDIVILREALSRANKLETVGGDEYLLGLTDTSPTYAATFDSARAVREAARGRARPLS